MKSFKFAALGLAVALTGCASGPAFKDVQSTFPKLSADQGRIYFYRESSMFGAAIQPSIKLDGVDVGTSKPGGFFYVDTKVGGHEVSTSTEVENKLTFVVANGETKYVKTSPHMGVMVGHVVPELIEPEEAKKDIVDLSYTNEKQAKE